MIPKKCYGRTVSYYCITIGLSWIPWLTAILIGSSVEHLSIKTLVALGGVGPMLSALFLIYSSKLKPVVKDYWHRVLSFKKISLKGYLFIFLIPPIMAAAAVLISLLFGKSLTQFQLVDYVRENILMIFPMIIFTFFFGPIPEELGWRGYWLDSLRTRVNGLTASVIIGIGWAMWHVPLFFINGYPMADFTSDTLKMFVYFSDLIPKAIIYTFVFYSNKRSTMAAILFHFMGNFTGTIIEIDTLTELIQMILLAILAVGLILRNKNIFMIRHTCQINKETIEFIEDGEKHD